MYKRQLKLGKKYSFFLFGLRGTGKSTLLKQLFQKDNILWIDLLLPEDDLRYRKNPNILIQEINALENEKRTPSYIVVDEVQKNPALLDVVHHLIEEKKLKFALTGSSARKLKRGGANLLAGRAFVFNLFPLTFQELGNDFKLGEVLAWGSLPLLYQENLENIKDKTRFLKAYVHTYLKEEILAEQLTRNIDPFYTFLETAAQMNGHIINFTKVARDSGVSDKTVEKYYAILEDTLLGFHLKPWNKSIRKQQISSAKFYFQDTGIVRALKNQFSNIERGSTYEYGQLFESYVICEAFRFNRYTEKDFKFFYLKTKDGVEIDLIIQVSSKKHYCIEIKSGEIHGLESFRNQLNLVREIPGAKFLVLSQNNTTLASGEITVYPWQKGLKKIFEI